MTSAATVGGPTAGDGVLPAPKAAIYFLGVLAGVQIVDPTIASTALVDASRGLDMSGGLLALAASISTLMLAATVVSSGLVGDRIGWRRMLVGALVVAIVGDLLAAAAPAPPVYLAGRAIAGIGLGGVFSASFAYVRIITPAAGVSAALGRYMATGSVILVTFSFLGGVVTTIDWRLAFCIIPVLSALCVVGAYTLLPETARRAHGPVDVTGQVVLGVGIVALLLGVSHAARGLGDPLTWGPIAAAVALFVAFAVVERRSAHPFFPIDLFRSPLFLGALCAGFVYNFAQSATVLQTSNLWQYVDGLTPTKVSLGTLPYLLTGIVAALVTGRLLSGRMTQRAAILTGAVLVAAGGVATLLHDGSRNYLLLLPALVLIGFGATMASIPYGGLVVEAATGRFAPFYGPIASSRTMFGQVAYALGMSVSTVMVDRLTTGGTVERLVRAGVPPNDTGTGLDAVRQFAQLGTDPTTALGQQSLAAAKESYAQAYTVTMLTVGLAALAAGVVGFVLLRRARHADTDVDDTTAAVTTHA